MGMSCKEKHRTKIWEYLRTKIYEARSRAKKTTDVRDGVLVHGLGNDSTRLHNRQRV